MPKKRINERYPGRYFRWRVFLRDDMFYADGRSNKPNAGKHSLGTSDADEVSRLIAELDVRRAVDLGLADPNELIQTGPEALGLKEGLLMFMSIKNKPRTLGGLAPRSISRYHAVFDKLIPFAEERRCEVWARVNNQIVEQYLVWLDHELYAHSTIYFEVNLIRQLISWLVSQKKLSETCRITVRVPKPNWSNRYCWTNEEVNAMLDWCSKRRDLNWMHNVIVALSRTGLRISELVSLRWSDLSKGYESIKLTDERSQRGQYNRTLKSGRDRVLPVHSSLKKMLHSLDRHEDGRILHGPQGGLLKPDTIRNVLIREVLVPLANRFPAWGTTGFLTGRLHSFRHFFCSECATQGIPEQVLKSWLGHETSEMIRRYYHLHDAASKKLMHTLRFDAPDDNTSIQSA